MTVTKQQQLEWLAKECHAWKGRDFILVSDTELGYRLPVTAGCHLITREEWQQERDKMQKQGEKADSWYERGELPPVGCAVDVTGDDVAYGYGESDCEVLAHVEDCAVIRMSFGLGCFVAKVLSPSRTEREREIDEMDAALMNRGSHISDVILGELYDAGFRMVKP